jgi:anti-sigma-K factor RskA
VNVPTPREPDLDSLLGAYALDALDGDERARVEEYIGRNEAARHEVDDLRESAASLALAPVDDLSAPSELWNRISVTIAHEQGATDELAARRSRRRLNSPWMLAAAAVAAIAVVLLAVQVFSLRRDLDDARSPDAVAAARFHAATKVEGARELRLVATHGSEVARVVLLPDGSGVLLNDHLDKLSSEETYQLWALMGDKAEPTAISAGVLGPDPAGASFKADGPVVGFAITVERQGGVTSPTHTPDAAATFA